MRPKLLKTCKPQSNLAQKGGFTRLLADAQFYSGGYLSETWRSAESRIARRRSSLKGDAEQGGDIYLLPYRLQSFRRNYKQDQGKYREASETYDRRRPTFLIL